MNRLHLVLVIALGVPAVWQMPPAAGAEPQEIVLWPAGVPEPRVPVEPAERVEKKPDEITRRANEIGRAHV